eukprot:gene38402-47413_t
MGSPMKKSPFKKIACSMLLAALACTGSAQATTIGVGGFTAPALIDFESAAAGAIGSQYAAQGITFVNFSLNVYATSPAPASWVALKFFENNPFLNGEVLFSSAVTRFGFDATTNPEDDTTLLAYLGNTLVGSHFFDTVGDGENGSFLGIEFAGGFDRVVIQTNTVVNGAIAIDNVRFENARVVPEPATAGLMAISLLALAAARRRKR